jgi:hypothetical protein
MHHTYGQWESASKMPIIVLYCILYYKYSSVIDENHFLISISKTIPFENDLFLISFSFVFCQLSGIISDGNDKNVRLCF